MARNPSPKKRIEELRAQISHHNEQYYGTDAPEISDAEYDLLMRELRDLETKHPELADEQSPTESVGAAAITTFDPVVHRVPMTSLDNAMDESELRAWGERVAKGLDGQPVRFVCELKIDGLAISIRYENGRMVQAASRGDGKVGEDVTANVATIRGLPSVIKDAPEVLEVRGEIYMSTAAFQKMKAEREAENLERVANGRAPLSVPVNPRNAGAGSLRQKDSAITAQRDLSLWSYQLGEVVGGKVVKSQPAEIGIMDINFSKEKNEDKLFSKFPNQIKSLQWHSYEVQGIENNKDITLLASSPITKYQIFKYQNHAYGIQFHIEIKDTTVNEWGCVPEYKKALEDQLGNGALEKFDNAAKDNMSDMNNYSKTLYDNFKKML